MAAGMPLVAAKAECIIPDVETALKLDLDLCRPVPVRIEEKNRIVQSLPVEGNVTALGGGEARKLTALEPVLRAHGRIGIYEIRVISVPQAWAGLHGRVALLISLPLLTLVSSDELKALVAHEIGHEYIWQEYADAKASKDAKRLRELELVCDVIAIRTLVNLGLPPERLEIAVEKTSWYNRERFGVASNEGNYPSLNERRRLIKQMSLLER